MRVRSVALSLLTALALVGSTVVASQPATAQTTLEARLIAKINEARARYGRAPLVPRAGLAEYARSHSGRMAGRTFLFHSDGLTTLCCWSRIGENVGTAPTVRRVHRAFMASPAHRANILDGRFRGVGIGIVRVGDQLWVTEVFRAPRG